MSREVDSVARASDPRRRALAWRLRAITIAVGAVVVPATARADASSDGRALFAHGRALRKQGDCSAAIEVFRRAYAVYPAGLGSLRNIAECQETLGHPTAARHTWLDLGRALSQDPAPRYAGWSQDATEAATRLEAQIATLTVDVSPPDPGGRSLARRGVGLTVNGEALPPELLGTAVDHDPGHYVVRASSPGSSSPEEVAVDLTAGQTRHVVLALPAAIATAAPEHAAPAPAPSDGARRIAAWTALGIGAAALVGAGVSLAVYESDRDSVTSACPNFNCPTPAAVAAAQPTVAGGKAAATWVNVFAAVGAAGVVGGLVLFAIHPAASSANVGLVVSPVGMAATGRF